MQRMKTKTPRPPRSNKNIEGNNVHRTTCQKTNHRVLNTSPTDQIGVKRGGLHCPPHYAPHQFCRRPHDHRYDTDPNRSSDETRTSRRLLVGTAVTRKDRRLLVGQHSPVGSNWKNFFGFLGTKSPLRRKSPLSAQCNDLLPLSYQRKNFPQSSPLQRISRRPPHAAIIPPPTKLPTPAARSHHPPSNESPDARLTQPSSPLTQNPVYF